MKHPEPRIDQLLTQLCDELCTQERITGLQSVLILREQGGTVFRATSGKPVPESCDDISDDQLVAAITLKCRAS